MNTISDKLLIAEFEVKRALYVPEFSHGGGRIGSGYSPSNLIGYTSVLDVEAVFTTDVGGPQSVVTQLRYDGLAPNLAHKHILALIPMCHFIQTNFGDERFPVKQLKHTEHVLALLHNSNVFVHPKINNYFPLLTDAIKEQFNLDLL